MKNGHQWIGPDHHVPGASKPGCACGDECGCNGTQAASSFSESHASPGGPGEMSFGSMSFAATHTPPTPPLPPVLPSTVGPPADPLGLVRQPEPIFDRASMPASALGTQLLQQEVPRRPRTGIQGVQSQTGQFFDGSSASILMPPEPGNGRRVLFEVPSGHSATRPAAFDGYVSGPVRKNGHEFFLQVPSFDGTRIPLDPIRAANRQLRPVLVREWVDRLFREFFTSSIGAPRLPIVIQDPPPPGGGREKVCGPDVTDWLVAGLRNFLMAAEPPPRGPIGEPGSQAASAGYELFLALLAYRNTKPGGNMDLKPPDRGVLPGNCPVDCPESVTLCGKCLSKQIPGNISFGLMGGRVMGDRGVKRFSNEGNIEETGRPDPPEDVASLDVGLELLGRRTELMRGTLEEATNNIKQALCDLITAELDGPKRMQPIDCPVCTQNYEGHP